jgi:hypothetical protein
LPRTSFWRGWIRGHFEGSFRQTEKLQELDTCERRSVDSNSLEELRIPHC